MVETINYAYDIFDQFYVNLTRMIEGTCEFAKFGKAGKGRNRFRLKKSRFVFDAEKKE